MGGCGSGIANPAAGGDRRQEGLGDSKFDSGRRFAIEATPPHTGNSGPGKGNPTQGQGVGATFAGSFLLQSEDCPRQLQQLCCKTRCHPGRFSPLELQLGRGAFPKQYRENVRQCPRPICDEPGRIGSGHFFLVYWSLLGSNSRPVFRAAVQQLAAALEHHASTSRCVVVRSVGETFRRAVRIRKAVWLSWVEGLTLGQNSN
jgi:hypothetical protein